MTFSKILVANRGEIARRILRTCRDMGLGTVAVCSEADLYAAHVREADEAICLGPAPSSESYLRIDRILEAARATGAQAIHPGYGFLSEKEDFARAVEAAGLVFVGPTPEAIAKMGSKIAAKRLMAAHGVPVVPGYDGSQGQDDAAFIAAAEHIGLPLLIKASAGGGGKGMRIVRRLEDLPAALATARREAQSSFGDPALLIERYIDSPRHIEVQILGDGNGHVIHLFERECSIQRRHQKVLEEAPSPGVDPIMRERLGAAAVAAGKAIGYRSAGTVEFVVDGRYCLGPDGALPAEHRDAHEVGDLIGDVAFAGIHFLEINTRIQVEHPVTELVTGLDLVRLQIEIAMGRPLTLQQDDLRMSGHAIEARLYAEDPDQDFLPQTGRLVAFELPDTPGLRVDTGVGAGDEVSIHYDPMLAKVIAWGHDRAEANRRLERALAGARVHGVTTNLAFLRSVLAHPAWRAGALSTHFIDEHKGALVGRAPDPAALDRALRIATVAHALTLDRSRALLPDLPLGWRNNRFADPQERWRHAGEVHACAHRALGERRFLTRVAGVEQVLEVLAEGASLSLRIADAIMPAHVVTAGDTTYVHVLGDAFRLEQVPRFATAERQVDTGTCQAPMTGKVVAVRVEAGQSVEPGQPLVVLEAMKMEHTLEAPIAGTVAEVLVQQGDVVQGGQDLVVLR